MKDPRKTEAPAPPLPDLADQAEHRRMVERFRDEETQGHMQMLLFQRIPLHPRPRRKPEPA